MDDPKNNNALLLGYIKFCAIFQDHRIQTGVTVRKRSIHVKIGDFLSHVTSKFYRWPWKTIGHLFYATSSFVHHFVAIYEFKLELWSGKALIWVKISNFFVPCELEISQMAFKNDREPLPCYIKLCASFHRHMWIQTGIVVQKRLNWALTPVTLTFDLWPWPLAWTSLLSMVITPENFMIHWQEHCEKGVTDRRTERGFLRAAWSQLKNPDISLFLKIVSEL